MNIVDVWPGTLVNMAPQSLGSKVIFWLPPKARTATNKISFSIKYHSRTTHSCQSLFLWKWFESDRKQADLAHYYFWLDILQSMFDKSIRINHKASDFHACVSTSSHMQVKLLIGLTKVAPDPYFNQLELLASRVTTWNLEVEKASLVRACP